MNNILTPVTSHEKMVKVTFDLGDHTESLWAIPLGSNKYQVQNIPFDAYGVSYNDVIVGKLNDLGLLVFEHVDRRGGHSTYRIRLNEETTGEQFTSGWDKLGSLGATYERATDRLIAVDIPPETDIYEAYATLESGEENNVWDFEEGHCGHPLKPS